MKLLILTQKIDRNDTVLGFFHRWVEEFAKHCEQVTVIALGVGEYHLPQNVRVFSLGKERGVSRLRHIINFYRLIWRERKNYDVVFAHMNEEYILIGGLFWKLFGKKVTMWRNHYAGSFLTDIAAFLCDTIFCTSKYSYTVKYKKTVLMPVGIDTDIFKKREGVERNKNSILFLSRIAPSKKPEILIEALRILKNEGVQFTADFYGDALPKDAGYLSSLKKKVKEYGMESLIFFNSGVPNNKTPDIYGTHSIFVNTSPSGMYDKTIFEAMACGTPVITSNNNLHNILPKELLFKENSLSDFTRTLQNFLKATPNEQDQYSAIVRVIAEKHSLRKLAQQFFIKTNS